MAEVTRNRTIRPTTREASSSYKIDTKVVTAQDTLIVNIDHESKSFRKSFHFSGKDIESKNSIHFSVFESSSKIEISWSGAKPKMEI